jgi:hypothetical protein
MKTLAPLLALLLAACGVADVGTSAATTAKLKVEEVRQGEALKAQIDSQLEAARQMEEQRRKEIDAQTR